MNTSFTLRAILVCAGACLPASLVLADPPGTQLISALAVAQSDGETKSPKAEAAALLENAREAMKQGNLETAESMIHRAEALSVSYGAFHLGDTPKKARRDLEKQKAAAAEPDEKKGGFAPLAVFRGGDDNEPPPDPFQARDNAASPAGLPATGGSQAQRLPPIDDLPPTVTRGALTGNGPPSVATAAPSGDKAMSDALLVKARKALAVGDVREATAKAGEAKAMGVSYDYLQDSPAKIEATIGKYNELMKLMPQGPADATSSQRRQYALLMMEQAEALRRWGEFDDAERLANDSDRLGVVFSPFDVTPEKLRLRIAASRNGETGGSLRSLPPVGTTSDSNVVPAVAEMPSGGPKTAKQFCQDLMGQARQALAAGDLLAAERFASQAAALKVTPSDFGPQEDNPGILLRDVQSARERGGATLVVSDEQTLPSTAGALVGPRYAETRALYDQQADPTRNVYAGTQEPIGTPLGRPTDGPDAGPTPLPAVAPGTGMQLFLDGEQALRNRDIPQALALFRQASTLRDELDPPAQQRLRDYLLDLSRPIGPPQQNSLLENVTAEQDQVRKQVSAELAVREDEARRLQELNPKQALVALQEARTMLEGSAVDQAAKEMLIRRVDRGIGELDRYINDNRAMIDLAEQNQKTREQIDRERQVKVEVQESLARLVDDFNKLMDEQRYAEAEIVAKRAQELAPEEQVVQQLKWNVRFIRRYRNQLEISDLKEQGVVNALESVDESSTPFDDRDSIIFGENWAELTKSRRALLEQSRTRRSEKELEIIQKLKTPVSLQFTDAPLAQVLDYLSKLTQVNLHVDPQGLADQGVSTDTPVTINLSEEISLKSSLNLILAPLNLGYVVEDEVLKITSQDLRGGKLITEMYNVADLVIPIPNFVPSNNMGMAGAIRDAYGTAAGAPAYGAQTPLGVVASRDGATTSAMVDPEILAQVSAAGGSMSPAAPGGRPGFGPGGLGGGTQADFDSLIQLITDTIAPESWSDGGGTGSIQEFATNLSLVVSNTQEVHDQIRDLLEQLRRLQDLQVTIEVRFITLNDNFFERIGIDFDFDIDDDTDRPFQIFGKPDPGFNNDFDGNPSNNPGRDTQDRDHGKRVVVGQAAPGVFSSDLDIPFQQGSFGLAVPQFGGFDATAGAQLGFAILSDLEAYFFISAAQGDRRSNVLQAPKVTLFNGQTALVSDTSQSPFVISVIPVVGDFAAAQQPVIVVLNQGTFMTVQAVVSSDRRFVRMTVVPFFSQIGDVRTFTFTGETSTTRDTSSEGPEDGTTGRSEEETVTTAGTTVQLPTFSFVTVTTTVSVPDGGTVLLGGIKRLSEGRNEFGVPMLNKLPYINRLFKNTAIGRETQSLMMMVTPRIIIQEEEEANLGIAPASP